MKEFDNLKDMIYCEIDDISHQGKLDMGTVKVLGELVDILKDIGSIEMFEEGINIQENDEYSFNNSYGRNGGYSQRRMPIYYDNYEGYGNSYRGNRGNGGYSRRGRNGYSREDSKEHMIQKLEEMMNQTQDTNDRDAIQRLINQMESK